MNYRLIKNSRSLIECIEIENDKCSFCYPHTFDYVPLLKLLSAEECVVIVTKMKMKISCWYDENYGF
jgi:hypothetical protein